MDQPDVFPYIPGPAVLWRSLKFWIWAVFIVLLLAAIPNVIVDYWFFESIGKVNVFWTTFGAQLAMFAVTWVVIFMRIRPEDVGQPTPLAEALADEGIEAGALAR